jgi:ACS family D-galactonate transporter-like MFS transporter
VPTTNHPLKATPSEASRAQWILLALLVASVFINYIDRSNLSVSATDIIKELGLTNVQMGQLFSAFFLTYAACQLLSGWLIDRFNVYVVFGAGFLLWSLATAGTGLVHAFVPLLIARLILGLGESVAYPAYSKIFARDYKESERGKANAFIDAGSKMGPALGTFLGGMIVAEWGWRSLFLILGLGALVWLPFWIIYAPRGHSRQSLAVREMYVPSMLQLLRNRSVWGSFFGLFAINYAWYFMITWFPPYLETARHFSKTKMAVLGSLPFVMLAISASLAGIVSDRLIGNGSTPTRVRKSFIITGLLLQTLLLPAGMAASDTVSMGLFLFACFAFGLTTANHWAVTQTIAGPAAAGKWTGMQNAFGNLAGLVAPPLTGFIVDKTKSFDLAFVAVAITVVLGALSYAFIIGRVEPVDWKPPTNLVRQ